MIGDNAECDVDLFLIGTVCRAAASAAMLFARQARRLPYNLATAPATFGGLQLPPVPAYLFGFTVCLAALLSFFCLAAVLAFACFCAACLFLVFGDLSPISRILADLRVIASFCRASASLALCGGWARSSRRPLALQTTTVFR